MHYVIQDHYLVNFTKGQVVQKELLEQNIDPDVIPALLENKQIRKATAAEVKAGFVMIEEPNPMADTLTDTSGELYQDYREAQATKLPAQPEEGEEAVAVIIEDGGSDSGDENQPTDAADEAAAAEAAKPKKKAGK